MIKYRVDIFDDTWEKPGFHHVFMKAYTPEGCVRKVKSLFPKAEIMSIRVEGDIRGYEVRNLCDMR